MFCVLRASRTYGAWHASSLWRMVMRHLPATPFVCLTDTAVWPMVREPLAFDWPGWWAKMELCRPDIRGPILFLDLDTVVLGGLSPLVADTSTSIACRDFFRGRSNPDALQSSLMLLTEGDRARVWSLWRSRKPSEWMASVQSDQIVIERALKARVRFWQDTHPGMVVGYKTDLDRGRKSPGSDARAVIFHGQPRPWECGHGWAERHWQ